MKGVSNEYEALPFAPEVTASVTGLVTPCSVILPLIDIRRAFSLKSFEAMIAGIYELGSWPALGTFPVALPLLFYHHGDWYSRLGAWRETWMARVPVSRASAPVRLSGRLSNLGSHLGGVFDPLSVSIRWTKYITTEFGAGLALSIVAEATIVVWIGHPGRGSPLAWRD
jgi:hypothetical protein